MGHHLRHLSVAVALVLVATACGDSDDGEDASATASATAETVVAESAAEMASEATEVEEAVVAGSAQLSAVDQRGVEVTLEGPPGRVVSIWDSIDAQNLLALGVEPVLVGRIGGGRPAPWVDDYAGLETYELGDGTNIEAVAAARPDLIVTASYDDAAYELLEQIAPLYVADNAIPWREELRRMAALLGRSEIAEEVIADRTAVIDAAAERLADWQGARLVAGVVSPGEEALVLFTSLSPLSELLVDMGLGPLTDPIDDDDTETYSFELLGELEGDALLFLDVSGIAGQDLSTFNDEFLSGPIVDTIPAVAGGIAGVGPEASAAARLVNAANLPFLVEEITSSLEGLPGPS
ncbi:MAG: ABC transporter substrate-binding protein [Actinomycetota bacterium]